MLKTVAVYGSLKKGKYNHGGIENCKHVGNSTIVGTMYAVSSYPALLTTGEDVHDVELYELPPEEYFSINRMEIGAGYVELEREFEVNGETVKALVYFAGERLESYCKQTKEVISSY